MIELFLITPWHQLYDFLAGGEPPMMARVLAVNTLFFILFAYRRAQGIPAMRRPTAVKVQSLLITANMLILFQDQIESTLDRFI